MSQFKPGNKKTKKPVSLNSLNNLATSTTNKKFFTVAIIIVTILSFITLALNFSWSLLIGIIFGALFLYGVYSTNKN